MKKGLVFLIIAVLPTCLFGQTTKHVISRGETLKSIAATYNLTEKEIIDANPGINTLYLVAGSSLNIPSKKQNKSTIESKASQETTQTNPSASDKDPDVIVKKTGETILARVTKVSNSQIEYKKWVNLDGPIYEISQSEVVSINFANGTKEDFLTKGTTEYFDTESKKSTTQHKPILDDVQPEEKSSEEEFYRGWGGGLQIGTFPISDDGGNDRIGIDVDYHFSPYFFVGGQAFFDVGMPYVSGYDITVFGMGFSPHVGVHLPLFGGGYPRGIRLYTGPSTAINFGGNMKKYAKDSEKIKISGGGTYSDWMVGIKIMYGLWLSAEYHANLAGSNAFNGISYFCIGIGFGI